MERVRDFIKTLRAPHEYNQKQLDHSPEFFEEEKRKVSEIRKLIKKGKHDEALNALLNDFASSDGIQYFNRIKHLEEERQSHWKNEKNVEGKETIPTTNGFNYIDLNSDLCCWEGFSSSRKALHCTNQKVFHPWKLFVNVCGIQERIRSDYCIYHQRYCVDEEKRHPETYHRILYPNNSGLCTECYVLKEGQMPQSLEWIPGIRINKRFDREITSTTKYHAHIPKYHRNDSHNCEYEDKQNTVHSDSNWIQSQSARRIQSIWRKHKLSFENELNIYERSNKQNMAALKIQRFVKSKIEAKYNSTSFDLLPCQDDNVIKRLPQPQPRPRPQPQQGRKNEDIEDLSSCLTIQHSSSRGNEHTESQREYLVSGTRKRNINLLTKCNVTACRLCNDNNKRILSRRYHISFHDDLVDQKLIKSRESLIDSSCFQSLDILNTGLIPQRKFLDLIKTLWQHIDQPLLPGEREMIRSVFGSDNGYINYQAYLNFAQQQTLPCAIHSRLVCADPKCCVLTSETEDVFNLNSNGLIIMKNSIRPRQRQMNSRKRGLQLFNVDDMKRTFARQTKPDVFVDLKFNDFNRCKDRRQEDSINCYHEYCKMKGKLKFSQKSYHDKKLSLPTMRHIIPEEKVTMLVNEVNNEQKIKEEDAVKPYTSFSHSNLKAMLLECIKERIPTVEKKHTIECPLCKLLCFDKFMLNKHIFQRHTKQEIELYLRFHHENNSNSNIDVQYIGNYIIVPPLEAPVTVNICQNHVPPHPKCIFCNDGMDRYPMFPPLRFYSRVFFHHKNSVGDSDTGNKSKFHFDVSNKELGIVLVNGRIAQIEALCQDRWQRNFLGIRYYFTYEELRKYLLEKGSSIADCCKQNGVIIDIETELVLDSNIDWVNMMKVKDRCHVFKCDHLSFIQKMTNMGCGDQYDLFTYKMKFCRLQWTGSSLEEL